MTKLVWIQEDPAIQRPPSLKGPKSQKPRKRPDGPVRGKEKPRGMIEMVPEDILLEIFDFYRLWAIKQYLEASWERWDWLHLARVCRKWRNVISLSPRRLDLRIVSGLWIPIGNVLRNWPTLPVVVAPDVVPWQSTSGRFHSPKSYLRTLPSLPRNIMAALRHPNRLCEINLDVKSSWTGPVIETVAKPCQALERIRIEVGDVAGPSILINNAFLGGSAAPLLRSIELNGISFPFPEIRRVLLSSHNLIKLHLFKIPHAAYFSPHDLVAGLSTLTQLKSLAVDFHSPASSPPFIATRRPPQSTTFPSLESFYFHGTSEYLEDFVSRIDLPALREITLYLFNEIFFDLPHLSQLIPRLKALESPTQLRIAHSTDSVSIDFFRDAGRSSRICSFKTSCRPLDWQLSFMTDILGHLSPLLSRVVHVTIQSEGMPTGKEDIDSTQWVELFRTFTQVKEVRVMEAELVPSVVLALVTDAMATGVLNELSDLYLKNLNRSSSFVSHAAKQFVSMRSLSGRPVNLAPRIRRVVVK